MSRKKIAVTGMGVVSPLGIGREFFWRNLSSGLSGFGAITLFDTKGLHVKVAGEIRDFTPKDILGAKNLMDLDRATLLLLCAAKLAISNAGLEIDEANTLASGICVGTTLGSLHSISKFDRESLTEGPRYVNPSIFPSTVGNSAASRLAIRFGIKGFNATISTGMCAGLDAIDYGRDAIELGRADTVLAGAVEDLSLQIFLGFYKLKYLSGSTGDCKAPLCCPFDLRRNGAILSEGATTLVLQDSKAASNKILAHILGIGSCFDPAKFYRYNPKAEGMISAMKLALDDARLSPKDIDCIFANANSTKDADYIETRAIKEVFGAGAEKVPVTAVKSMLGESYSVSGGFAAIAAIEAIQNGYIPPTINYTHNDPRCDLDYVPNNGRKIDLKHVMVNAFGPNGGNTCLILGR